MYAKNWWSLLLSKGFIVNNKPKSCKGMLDLAISFYVVLGVFLYISAKTSALWVI